MNVHVYACPRYLEVGVVKKKQLSVVVGPAPIAHYQMQVEEGVDAYPQEARGLCGAFTV